MNVDITGLVQFAAIPIGNSGLNYGIVGALVVVLIILYKKSI
jgi:hypothetical protein